MFSKSDAPSWLAIDGLLLQFGTSRSQAEDRYARFVLAGIHAEAPWSGLRDQIYLGDEAFVDQMKSQIEPDRDDLEIPKTQRRRCTMDLTEIAEVHKDRKAAMRAAYQSGSYTLRQIAEHFGVHYSTVSRAINV